MLVAGIIAAVLFAAGFIRLGISVRYSPGAPLVRLRIGVFRLRVYPQKPRKKAQKEKPKPAAQKKEKPPKKPGFLEQLEGFTPEDIGWLLTVVQGLFRKMRKGIRIDRLEAEAVLGGRNDPYKTALQYGILMSAIGTILPVMDETLRIKRFHISVHPDFEREGHTGQCRLEVTLSVGRGLGLGFYALRVLIKAFVRFRGRKPKEKAHKPQTEENKAA